MNCWEVKKCGREKGGDHVSAMGECPASLMDAGQACWLVAGTFCDGTVQGTFAQKEYNCTSCEYFCRFDLKHKVAMRKKFLANRNESDPGLIVIPE